MIVEAQILTALKGNTSAGNNVSALVLPFNATRPAITYQRISSDPVTSLTGYSNLERVHMQIDCWADTFGAAVELSASVRPLMAAAGFKGLPGSDWAEYEPDTDLYRVSRDYFCWQ